MHSKRKFVIVVYTILLYSFLTSNHFTQTRINNNELKNIKLAVNKAVSTYKESGMIGLSMLVEESYMKNKNKLFNIYLDIASRQLDQIFVIGMNYPPNEYFNDDNFYKRIKAKLAKVNINKHEAMSYLESITPVIDKYLQDKLLNER